MAKVLEVTSILDVPQLEGCLRNAIELANLEPNELTIIKLSSCLNGRTIELINGELSVLSNIRIEASRVKGKCCKNRGVRIKVRDGLTNRIFNIADQVKSFVIDGAVTLVNGDAGNGNGGAILFNNPAGVILLNGVSIKRSRAFNGGGVYSLGETVLFETLIKANRASNQGGGCWVSGQMTLDGCQIIDNKIVLSLTPDSQFGAGLVVNGSLNMSGSSVSRNLVEHTEEVGGYAGGIYITGGDLHMNSSQVDENEAYASAGIYQGIGSVYMTGGSSVSHNKSYNYRPATGGGGITILFGTVYVESSKICKNITRGMYSGGIVSLIGSVNVKESEISGNVNNGPGGAIACNFGAIITVESSKIFDNTGASLGGAIVNFSLGQGGINIFNSQIENNCLTNAQTVLQTIEAFLSVIIPVSLPVETQLMVDQTKLAMEAVKVILGARFPIAHLLGGGAIATLLFCPVNIVNSQIENNYAGKFKSVSNPLFFSVGGAIFTPNSPLNLENVAIINNRSNGLAGGVFSNTQLYVLKSKFEDNVASDKATYHIDGLGGGLYLDSDSNGVVVRSTFSDNKSHEHESDAIYNAGNLKLIKNNIKETIFNTGTIVYI